MIELIASSFPIGNSVLWKLGPICITMNCWPIWNDCNQKNCRSDNTALFFGIIIRMYAEPITLHSKKCQ